MRRSAKLTKAKAAAKVSVSGKAPKSEAAGVRGLEERLEEALRREAEALRREAEALGQLQTRDRELVEAQGQRTATSEILRIISNSPTDLQPVFDTIAASALRLCASIAACGFTTAN